MYDPLQLYHKIKNNRTTTSRMTDEEEKQLYHKIKNNRTTTMKSYTVNFI